MTGEKAPCNDKKRKEKGMGKDYTFKDGRITYVPEFDGNRDDKNPITVDILPLTVGEAQKRSGNVTAKRVKGGGFQTNSAKINQKTFAAHVGNITNLTVNGKPVTTGEELFDTMLHDLVDEINEAMTEMSMLNEGDIKNFELQSDGSLEKIPGTAPNATNNDRETETAAENTEQ